MLAITIICGLAFIVCTQFIMLVYYIVLSCILPFKGVIPYVTSQGNTYIDIDYILHSIIILFQLTITSHTGNLTESIFEWIDGEPYNSSGFTKMTQQDEEDALASEDEKCVVTHLLG